MSATDVNLPQTYYDALKSYYYDANSNIIKLFPPECSSMTAPSLFSFSGLVDFSPRYDVMCGEFSWDYFLCRKKHHNIFFFFLVSRKNPRSTNAAFFLFKIGEM